MSAATAPRLASLENSHVPVARQGEFEPLQLGKLTIWPPVVLAPMAGVTNYPFRSLCRSQGAGLFVSEMITARGYLLGNRLTHKLAYFGPDERPRSLQIYSAEPRDVGEMVKRLVAEERVDHLDMNFGCPVRKVTRCGGGSAIPVRPKLLARIVRAAVENAGSVPVTIKMRKGIDEGLLTFLEAGRVAEAEGVQAVGLHARTAAQLYSGAADWNAIGELVAALRVPVLGNGDIWESFDALRMARQTGCKGVIVGRGCLGRPWLFRELAQVFAGQEPSAPPNLGQILEVMLDHARRLVDFFGETMGLRQMRKWAAWYTKGFRGSSAVRAELVRMQRLDELRSLVERLDLNEPFPVTALRAHRAKGSQTQRVTLPEGYMNLCADARSMGELGLAAEEGDAADDSESEALSGG
jgi:nifR3 family TIM-barrel protein